uniref:Uncharacterized protein n=1 Tax=Arundo donax TaxID=35708 RepID=A0A0A9HWM9_ARUDO
MFAFLPCLVPGNLHDFMTAFNLYLEEQTFLSFKMHLHSKKI